MSRRSLLLLMTVPFGAYVCYVRAEQNPYARYVAAGFSVIDRWSLQDVADEDLFEGAMVGMVAVLRQHGDEHSQYVPATKRDAFKEDMSQEFGGVGIRVRILGDPPLPTVVGPPERGSPAFNADVQSGDRLIAVDGTPVAELPLDRITSLIRGPVGAPVRLSFTRFDGSDPYEVDLSRAVIVVDSILGDVRDAAGGWAFRLADHPEIGYLQITKFGDKTASELGAALANVRDAAEPLQGIVLDLRDNAGGALDAAVKISDMFLPPGLPIVTTRGRDQKVRDRYLSTGSGLYRDVPLAVLVNRNSASAAEILAACLQDYQRAAIVGERTYGKGTVQRIVHLESGRSILKITSATYWRPSGSNIHHMPDVGPDGEWGVSPDPAWQVAMDDKQYAYWRRYRSRRDLMGRPPNIPLLHQLDLEDGALPDDFVDQTLVTAVKALSEIVRTGSPSLLNGP